MKGGFLKFLIDAPGGGGDEGGKREGGEKFEKRGIYSAVDCCLNISCYQTERALSDLNVVVFPFSY